MLYLSYILLIKYVSFQRKAKVKLGNYFKEIIEIVGNGAGKDLKCHLQMRLPTTCEKQASGLFSRLFQEQDINHHHHSSLQDLNPPHFFMYVAL